MSRYRKIEPIVDAVQWFNGDEYPNLRLHNNCNYRMCEICGGNADSIGFRYIKSGWDKLIVRDGDWIIDLSKGYYRVMSDSYFKNCYEKIEE